MLAAVVQLQSTADVQRNLDAVDHWLGVARARGAELAVLPENFAYQGSEADKREIAEVLGEGPISRRLCALAGAHGLDLIAGGMPERSDDPQRPYNTSVHIARNGALAARYRKIHLFDVDPGDGHAYRESAATRAGHAPVLTTVQGISVGMSICYDLRFPELYRSMQDARVVTVPAAFTLATGKDHWQVLLRARAIENQVFVLAPGQHGTHPDTGRTTYGKSMIIDPWGDVLAQAPEGAGVAVAELDFARQDALRRAMPVCAHRRL